MQLFDPYLDMSVVNDGDLDNLAYFDTHSALFAARPRFATLTGTDWAKATVEDIARHAERLRDVGIQSCALLDMRERTLPERARTELWYVMPSLLSRSDVLGVVIAEGPAHAQFDAILSAVSGTDSRLFIGCSLLDRTSDVRLICERLAAATIDPARVAIVGIDYTNLRLVLDRGLSACLQAGPHGSGSIEIAEMLDRFDVLGHRRIFVASGTCQSSPDVIAIPKLALRLSQRGAPPHQVRSLVWDNAARFFAWPQ